MHDIYKLKDMLCDELEEYGKKGEITANSLELVDKLAHTVKNLDKIIKSYEEEEEGYSMNTMYYDDGMGRTSMRGRGGSYARGGRGGSSYARGGRGRGSYARRGGGYSGADESMDEVLSDMREMMQDLPQEKKMEVQRFIQKMEQM